ncbi:MAG TPA: hypothetical protein PKA10_14480 [Selenomonadales bacterium]|nr:hypothetical protein [Selenomonadales bacterium]
MKKQLLAAAVLAALTISTASVFAAAPTFSGDANIEYSKKSDEKSELTNRIRLAMDSEIDNNIYLHGRLVMNNDLDRQGTATPVGNDKGAQMEQLYVGFKMDNADLKLGRQPLFLGHGLLSDVNGIGGAQITTTFDNANLMGFYGRDNDVDVAAAELGTSIGDWNLGASYLDKDDTYYGVNASTKVAPNTVLNMEYVKNNDAKASGYWAEVKVGDAVKKGDFDYSLGYVKLDEGAVDGNYVTEGNMAGNKGFRVKANYAVSDNSTLTVYQDLFKQTSNNDITKNRTDVEYEVRF